MAEKAPKHPKRYGGNKGKGGLLRDYKDNTIVTAGRRAASVDVQINNQQERPQRLHRLQRVQHLSTDEHATSRPATHPDTADQPFERRKEPQPLLDCADDGCSEAEDGLVAETAFPGRNPGQRQVYTCDECGMADLTMMELSSHYNLNAVENGYCKQLQSNIEHFSTLLAEEFELDLVDQDLQQKALEYSGDLLGIDPIDRTASRMCDLVTTALCIDEMAYNSFPSGLPSVPTSDFKQFPGCHDTISIRDHELVFCSEEVARLGPMSNINSLVHLSTTLSKIAIQEALAEALGPGSPTRDVADPSPQAHHVFPSALGLPEYFKLFWLVPIVALISLFNVRVSRSCSSCGYIDLLGPKRTPTKCKMPRCPRLGQSLDARVFVQDFAKHITRLRQRTSGQKSYRFNDVKETSSDPSLTDLTETQYFQALVARYGSDATYAQFYVDGVNPYSGLVLAINDAVPFLRLTYPSRQRNRDTVEIGTLTFANFDLSTRTKPANTHTLFVAEGGVKMNGLQAILSLLLRRSLPFQDKSCDHMQPRQQPVILTHILGDLPAIAAFMDHAGHSHKCGCSVCNLQADTASTLDNDVTHHTQTFARRREVQGEPRTEQDLRAATRAYIPQQRVRTVANVVSVMATMSLPRNKTERLPPRPVRRGTQEALYATHDPTNRTGSFQAACSLLCLEYTQLEYVSKSIDVMHNNYLGIAK
jgi:hypothetical protein